MLEEDAKNVLQYMASNGLVANPTKTAFMILNHKQEKGAIPEQIKIGQAVIMAESNAKLLGVTLDNNQKWKTQIQGVGGTISNLNSRLYLLRRLARVISKDRLRRISDSLYTSKIRYGVQLFGKVRLNEQDQTDSLLDSLQITQNKFARFLHGSSLMDHISTRDIFNATKLLSVNQINAQIKITEVWKSQNITNYPTIWTKRNEVIKRPGLKSTNKPELMISGKSYLQSHTFYNDAAKVWNGVPVEIKKCKTLISAKKSIKKFVLTLPI